MLGTIVGLVIIGLIAGALARLIIPGKQDISIGLTIVIGMVGSLVGGFLGYVLFHKDKSSGFVQPSGWFGSIVGAVIVLALYLKFGPGRKSVR